MFKFLLPISFGQISYFINLFIQLMKSKDLFELPEPLSVFSEFFKPEAEPWTWVKNIGKALESLDFSKLDSKKDIPAGVEITGDVYIHPSVKLPPFAQITGPAWIGEGTEVRAGCFIRGNVIIGANCVAGNSCEFKNSMILGDAQVPHFNYVGDSILGNRAHLGAGVICANLRMDRGCITVATPDGRMNTGMRKLGAIMGDAAEAGCNAVLQPGTILMKRAVVFSGIAFSGLLEENMMAAERVQIRKIERRGF